MAELSEQFFKLLKSKKTKTKDIQNFIQTNIFDINALDEKGYNALHYAIKQEKGDIVHLLLNLESTNEDMPLTKADPNIETYDIKDQIKTSPIFLALLYVNDDQVSSRMIKSLINAGAKLDYKDEEGLSFFLRICEKGRTDLVSFILNLNPCPIDINKEVANTGSALHISILSDQSDIISQLLNYKIDLSLLDKDNNTALHVALIDNKLNYFKEIIDYLIENKDIDDATKKKILNAINSDGNTILHELSFVGSSTLINFILRLPKEIAVDPTIKNKNGFDYKEVEKDLILKKQQEEEKLQKEKDERYRLKMEARKEKEEEERRQYEERQRMKEKMERQEALGKKLMEYRGFFFLGIFVCIMVILFALVKNATKKKEIIL